MDRHLLLPQILSNPFNTGLWCALERKVFASCDQLISVSPAWSKLYAAKGAQPESKIHTITNGFDQEDFSGHHEVRPAQFTITYAGTLAASIQ